MTLAAAYVKIRPLAAGDDMLALTASLVDIDMT